MAMFGRLMDRGLGRGIPAGFPQGLMPKMSKCVALLLVALPLSGCADYLPGGQWVSGLMASQVPAPSGSLAPVVVAPMDPLSQFAMNAGPGERGSVLLANGSTENARVLRAYNAASGRECREVLLGAGSAERSQLVCGNAAGFQVTSPLLRGSGVR